MKTRTNGGATGVMQAAARTTNGCATLFTLEG